MEVASVVGDRLGTVEEERNRFKGMCFGSIRIVDLEKNSHV